MIKNLIYLFTLFFAVSNVQASEISKPIVSGKDGREALNLAITIQKKIEES